jgi:glutamyl-tRNA synthetase
LLPREAVNRSGSVFDVKKLEWVSQQYLQSADAAHLAKALLPYLTDINISVDGGAPLPSVANLLRDRAKNLVEMAEASRYFYQAPTSYDEKARAKQFKQATANVLQSAASGLEQGNEWSAESIQAVLDSCVETLGIGFGKLGQPLRLAITGGTQSPSLADTLALIDKADVLQRVDAAIAVCKDAPA